ncbi:hypothetical protein BDB01DRAFT_848419 [Pilobolus umbonatus]|nr:hypothetical protein BDB01DRAFT_848419 [Pilobolus umbonatus]
MGGLLEDLFPNKGINTMIRPIQRYTREELKKEVDEAAHFRMEFAKVLRHNHYPDDSKLYVIPIEYSILNLFKKPNDPHYELGIGGIAQVDSELVDKEQADSEPADSEQVVSEQVGTDKRLTLYPVEHTPIFGSLLSLLPSTQQSDQTEEDEIERSSAKKRKLMHTPRDSDGEAIDRVHALPDKAAERFDLVVETVAGTVDKVAEAVAEAIDLVEETAVAETAIAHTQDTTTVPSTSNTVVPEVSLGETHKYFPRCVPVYASSRQMVSCDHILQQKSTFSNVRLEQCVEDLTFPKEYDDFVGEQWMVNSKQYFLVNFLKKVASTDLLIVITTRNMDDETSLLSLVRQQFKFVCTRVGNILNDEWKDEYGLFVKTGVDSTSTVQQIERKYGSSADLIISLDFRIEEGDGIFTKLSNRNPKAEKIPTLWLINVKSPEERALVLMKEKKMSHWKSTPEAMEKLLSEKIEWPVFEDNQWEIMNNRIIDSVIEWIGQRMKEDFIYREQEIRADNVNRTVADKENSRDKSTDDISDMEVTDDEQPIPKVIINEHIPMLNNNSTNISSTNTLSTQTTADKEKYTEFIDKAFPLYRVNTPVTEDMKVDEDIKKKTGALSDRYHKEALQLQEEYNHVFKALKETYVKMAVNSLK